MTRPRRCFLDLFAEVYSRDAEVPVTPQQYHSNMQAFSSHPGDRLLRSPCNSRKSFNRFSTSFLHSSRGSAHCSGRHSRGVALSAAGSSRRVSQPTQAGYASFPASGTTSTSRHNSSRLQTPYQGCACSRSSSAASSRGQHSRSSSALQAVSSLTPAAPTALTAPEEKLWIPFKVSCWGLL